MESTINEKGDFEFPETVKNTFEKISSLKKADKFSRISILKELHNTILVADEKLLRGENGKEIWEKTIRSLLSMLSDDSEKCREIAVLALKDIFSRVYISETIVPELMSVLSLQLGKTDEREKSEEVRLLEINLLHNFINNYNNELVKYFNALSSILSNGIIDECPEIKRQSCECLSLLAAKQSKHFHMMGRTFLKPILSSISHQHLKTRVLSIKALGSIVDYLNSEEFEQAISHLAQRLFDRSPIVRKAVIDVVGDMLILLKDRYSYFHRLIPLMLSVLYDEIDELRSKAQILWERAGNQYISENESDYKDLIDFPRPEPDNYPEPGKRPIIGCRILVQRHIFNILPAVINDLKDWVVETRRKTSHVLYSLLLHAENKITIQLAICIEGIINTAKDEDREVTEQIIKSAELLGYFVDPNLLCDSVLKLMHQAPSAAHLSVLAAVLRGYKGTLSTECLDGICKFLSNPSVCQFRGAKEQTNLLLCAEGLLLSSSHISPSASYDLFTIITSVSGLSATDSVSKEANTLQKKLAGIQSNKENLSTKPYIAEFLKSLITNNALWTFQSPEMSIFATIIKSETLDKEMVGLITPALVNNLHPSKDPKLRSKMLSLLINVFKQLSFSDYEVLNEKILDLIKSGLFPNLIWAAGKTAKSLRALAAASLYEIIHKSCIKKEMLKSIGEELPPMMTTLLEDEDATTRLLACKILELILPELVGVVDDLKIHRIGYNILPCMDDESDDVRLMAIRVLKAYINSYPPTYDWKIYRSYLKEIYANVLIHMDDEKEKVRLAVFELLKKVGHAAPDVLLEEIESKRYSMLASGLCEELTEHIKNIKL